MRERVFPAVEDPPHPDATGAGPAPAVGQIRCDHCGGWFSPPRRWSRFCDDPCRRANEQEARALAKRILEYGQGRLIVELTPGDTPKVMTEHQVELPLDTRRAARENIEGTGRAQRLRERALEVLQRHGPRTADETAEILNESPFAVRPRFTELRKLSAIVDTGERRRNKSGNTARVWRAVR